MNNKLILKFNVEWNFFSELNRNHNLDFHEILNVDKILIFLITNVDYFIIITSVIKLTIGKYHID